MKEIALYILLVATFLTAAKTHGRQHRLERELRGYHTVSFVNRSQNPPWVNNFWFRQRIVYWTIATTSALLLVAWRLRADTSAWKLYAVRAKGKLAMFVFFLSAAAVAMILAFIANGLLSLLRLGFEIQTNAPPADGWVKNAIEGSAFWWLLTAALLTLMLILLKKAFVASAPSR